MPDRKRVRVRRKNTPVEQRTYDYAYHRGYKAGQDDRHEELEKVIEGLRKEIQNWEGDYHFMLDKEEEHKETISQLQKSNSTLYDQLHKARLAADGWRKQVRELTFENK